VTIPYDFDFYRNQGNLSVFLRKIRQYPMLSLDDERRYMTAWQKHEDNQALEALMTSHLRLVAKIANGFKRYGLSQEDLISEGTIGLLQSIHRFDQSRGFRLSTYAKWWIRAAMQEYIMRSWSLVRIGTTVGQKKLFFNLRRMKMELSDGVDSHLSNDDVELIMKRLNVAEHEVLTMEKRMSNQDSSLNVIVNDEETTEWQDRLMDPSDDQETSIGDMQELAFQRKLISQALEQFSERERQIFIDRRIQDDRPTLGELGERFNISPERVRQIEHTVFNKIKEIVQKEAERLQELTELPA